MLIDDRAACSWTDLIENHVHEDSEDTTALEALRSDRAFMDRASRQVAAYGLEAMVKLISLRVCLVGLRGAGIEAAKNITLGGCHTLTLIDSRIPSSRDLGTNFFLSEGDVGGARSIADVCAPKLQELNASVAVVTAPAVTEQLIAIQHVVVVFDATPDEVLQWSAVCRAQANPVVFMSAMIGGGVASLFCDFVQHTVKDPDGNAPLVKLVETVEERTETVDGVEHPYTLVRYISPIGTVAESLPEDGVETSGLESAVHSTVKVGSQPLNLDTLTRRAPVYAVTRPNDPKNSCRLAMRDPPGIPGSKFHYIHGFSAPSASSTGRLLTQKKLPKTTTYKPLWESLVNPSAELLMTSFEGTEAQVHCALIGGIWGYRRAHGGALPPAWDEAATAEVVAHAKSFAAANPGVVDALNEDVVKRVASCFEVELQPLSAFLGGIVGQEVMKISGKYTPIKQWLHYSVLEVLPPARPADVAATGSRYESLELVFGKRFVAALGNLRLFMVGCGALGCEFMKNFALNGFCCGSAGKLTVTDNDRIEVSNLNRQFLFRESNVGKAKSEAAGAAAVAMNRAFRVDARQDFVGPSTEHIFNEMFWLKQDFIVNALDNMTARFYVDSQCVLFELPLFDSGTMGAAANFDVVIPRATRSYQDGGQSAEGGGVPMCTLRNFPQLPDHCIEWARAQFEDLFNALPAAANQFLRNPSDWVAKHQDMDTNDLLLKLPTLKRLRWLLDAVASCPKGGPSMSTAMELAAKIFAQSFRDILLDLMRRYPSDAKTSAGDPFWGKTRTFPRAVPALDMTNPLHSGFLIAAGNLFANVLKLRAPKGPSETNDPNRRWMAQYREVSWATKLMEAIKFPDYIPSAMLDDTADNSESLHSEREFSLRDAKETLAALNALASTVVGRKDLFNPEDFEKDDDDNFHIDFITACANLRAWNYHISQTPAEKVKQIAGRIIPAVATTTAAITGLVMVEIFKLVQNRPVEDFRNGQPNLAINDYITFQPLEPVKLSSHVKITNPDPAQFPDAYDAKGQLTDMYKDPDMGLGFAEWEKYYPDPSSKYDKFFIDGCTPNMTLAALKTLVETKVNSSGANLSIVAILGPKYTYTDTPAAEEDASADAKKGIYQGAATFWNHIMKSTHVNLERPLNEVVKERTSSAFIGKNVTSETVDLSSKTMFAGLSFMFQDADGDDVEVPPIILKFVEFNWQPFPLRAPFISRAEATE